ncbi:MULTISPECIES: T9SS type A sorting domain-containing protein [Flavobacterium]|uniref:T9SS type A sorting domain-containing protein n=1 Tax=Flavobacterium TaxID=237 RepID=UPI001FCA4C88|nr:MULTISPECIES: T9SS type A sorting domain-containing protein [Flavobacterium]UOK42653.1 T9SS type A sorting domain-containing protein [Flavobacterium enshiense]
MRKIIFLFITVFTSLIGLGQDGSLDLSFNPTGVRGVIDDLLLQPDGKILTVEGYSAFPGNWISRLNSDGSLDTGFNSALGEGEFSFGAIQADGKILVIHSHVPQDGYPASGRIYRLKPDGSLDESFKTLNGANGSINALALQPDGKIIISGGFSMYNGSNVNRMVRLNTDGTLDTGISFKVPAKQISNIKLLPDGKILAYLRYDDQILINLGTLVRLNSDWSLDYGFNQSGMCRYSALHLKSSGKMVITTQSLCEDWSWDPEPFFNPFYGLNNDGSYDANFHSGVVDFVDEIYYFRSGLQSDDKIIIAGSFTTFDGIPVNHIARLNPDGTLDQSFNGGTGPDLVSMNYVSKIITQPDGKIIIAGAFSQYNGVQRNNMARINSTVLSSNEFETKAFTFYPNPVKEVLYLSIPDEIGTNEFEIFDLLGKTINTGVLVSNQINVSDLSNGLYLLKIKTEKGIFVSKVLKK